MLTNDFDKISLKRFKIKSILPDATILILGRRRSGKSFLVRDIFYHHQDIQSGVIFSGTEEASPFFGDFIPDSFIHPEYDPELIDNILTRQKRKIRETKASGLSDSGKHKSNNLFIVLDDMLHDAQNWKKEKTIKSIFFNGRHYNIFFILKIG